jgi:hypothetical protein
MRVALQLGLMYGFPNGLSIDWHIAWAGDADRASSVLVKLNKTRRSYSVSVKLKCNY